MKDMRLLACNIPGAVTPGGSTCARLKIADNIAKMRVVTQCCASEQWKTLLLTYIISYMCPLGSH